ADSMQLYKDMDAGTAKPTPEQRRRVPHHLVDLFPASHEPTVAEFQTRARAAVADISSRGRLPLVVGGSGLYFRAVVDDLDFPPRDPGLRRRLEEESHEVGPEALHARLTHLDPIAAARIEPQNARRIVRALEVIELTGAKFSANDSWERYESRFDLRAAGLTRSRDELFPRIAERVDAMLARGLVAEAKALEHTLGITGRQALGYRQVLEADEDDDTAPVRDAIVRATKRFARRQESWFRADPRIAWFEASSPTIVDDLVAYLAGSGEQGESAQFTRERTVP
ncbi:MAG: tRNA (adenosine(37)-N6)-dimethylallyltransferase MiaA, partial [Actinomycetota bacterium]|nr:tRNA (adenosine(37)-N6)-dimethylallyltransferase MiaA [Actinomycetota bacterium]